MLGGSHRVGGAEHQLAADDLVAIDDRPEEIPTCSSATVTSQLTRWIVPSRPWWIRAEARSMTPASQAPAACRGDSRGASQLPPRISGAASGLRIPAPGGSSTWSLFSQAGSPVSRCRSRPASRRSWRGAGSSSDTARAPENARLILDISDITVSFSTMRRPGSTSAAPRWVKGNSAALDTSAQRPGRRWSCCRPRARHPSAAAARASPSAAAASAPPSATPARRSISMTVRSSSSTRSTTCAGFAR